MRLERIGIALAPGSSWAALDLGFALGRRWFWPLVGSWALVAVPVLLLSGLLLAHSLWLAMLVLWWLKPACEQLPLYFLSRAVFGEPPAVRALAGAARRWLPRQLLANLLWRRLSPSRSFNAPVAQLEELRGRARRARLAVLHDGHGARSWLTIAGVHFESVFYLALIVTGYLLLPAELAVRDWVLDHPRLLDGAQLLIYFIAMALIAPFYVAAGFTLYLHRRARLEAWDIELEFRRLAARAATAGGSRAAVLAVAALALMTLTLAPRPAPAAEPLTRAEARAAIDEVLADRDFGERRTVTTWRLRPAARAVPPEAAPRWPALLARFGELLLWAAAAGALAYGLYRLPDWQRRLARRPKARRARAAPAVRFGLAVRPESLPADVPAAARALAARGARRAALALLYRASLAALIERHGLELRAAATEGECLRQLRAVQPGVRAEFFARLTGAWQRAAYAHRPPEPAAIDALCDDWAAHFGDHP